jgi:toxin ParE1/3/4
MSRYVLSPLARQDLNEIWEHIAEDDLDTADRFVDELEAAMDAIAKMPGMGHVREDLADVSHRFWPVRSYLIVYHSDTKPVEVVRVLHAARDVASLL